MHWFLFCKDGAICVKNSPKRTSHGVARVIVKGTSLRSPCPIMAPDIYSKLESYQASCALLVKTPRKPLYISFGNVRKSKFSGTKLKVVGHLFLFYDK